MQVEKGPFTAIAATAGCTLRLVGRIFTPVEGLSRLVTAGMRFSWGRARSPFWPWNTQSYGSF